MKNLLTTKVNFPETSTGRFGLAFFVTSSFAILFTVWRVVGSPIMKSLHGQEGSCQLFLSEHPFPCSLSDELRYNLMSVLDPVGLIITIPLYAIAGVLSTLTFFAVFEVVYRLGSKTEGKK